MTQSLFLLGIVIAVAAVFLVIYLPASWLAERIRKLGKKQSQDEPLEGLILAEDQAPARSWAENLDRRFRAMVRQTGTGWTPDYVLIMTALWAILACGLVYLLQEDLLSVTMALATAVLIPLLILHVLRLRWRSKVQHQMPDVFFLMSRSMRAGLTIDQALTTAAQMGPLPMAKELNQAVEQCKLGLAVTSALQSVAGRLNMVDFDAFVMTVSLHRNVGGNLSLLLDRLATSVRDRNLFRGYFLAATALGRVTAIFLAIAAPVLFVGSMLLQPESMSRFTSTTSGLRLLAISGGLEVLGCLWLYWLLRSDY
ncbi:MAG TPA: type II secretion system F family protein [Gemmataceae bacterium]|nr:type II secretion system F family protein [Gemmataceae bacterium]